MATKTPADRIDHAIELYLSGESLEKIKSDCGVSRSVLFRERSARGIPPRPTLTLPESTIARQYVAGASENGLAKQYGVSRSTIERILSDAGVSRRTMSEAAVSRAASMTPAQRTAQVIEANKAARKRRVPEIEKYRRALTIERIGRTVSDGERVLREMLTQRGETPQVERAVGPYNLDLAVLPVAVEVLGGGFHADRTAHTKRVPYILDAGWHLVMVWDTEGDSAITAGAADYIVTFADEVRRNPPATCQYRVISGSGELLAARGREDNEFPVVRPARRSLSVRP